MTARRGRKRLLDDDGPYDLVLVVGAPDVKIMARIVVPPGRSGAVRIITMKAFDEAQNREIIGLLS